MNSYQQKQSQTNTLKTSLVELTYPKIGKALLLMFCGYVIIWYLQIGHRIPFLGSIRFEFLYAAVLTAIAFFFTPKIDTKCPLIPYILLYFIVITIQIPFSQDLETSWNIFIDRIVKFSFMAFFIVAFVRSPHDLKFFLGAFLLACLKMGQEGLLGRITGGLIWENQGIMRLHGATPLYEHPNSFAGMALGTLPFVYYLWPHGGKIVKILLLILGFLSLHIVLFTGSRTGYVGMTALILFLLIKSSNKKRFIIGLIIIAMVAAPFVPSDYLERFESIFTGKDKEGQSTEMRKEILRDAWQIFLENPLGVGVSAFPKVRMEKFGRSQDTHNLYLEIATNLGVHGLIVVLLFFYKILATLRDIRHMAKIKMKAIAESKEPSALLAIKDLKLIESVSLAVSSFIIIRLALGLFGMDLYEIYWWFATGLTIALYSMVNRIQINQEKSL